MPATPSSDAPDRVLSTLNRDGSRRWLFPRVSPGRFLNRRRMVAYALLVLYNVLPWIQINGKPSILLDLPNRRFTFFGVTFFPTDTLLLMLFVVGVFVTVFLVTALFGRLWCGWACPQTVYMEFVYRPIERFFEGSPDARRRGASPHPVRVVLKYVVFFLVSFHLAHTFLAYFVGVDNLLNWTRQSPFEHPTSFLIVAATTGLMIFDFCFFREQVCIVACPYGRFQSVMLDRDSLIIGYDEQRGEPRGKLTKKRATAGSNVELPQVGDCIDCKMCVTTCPTGIDIRDGLQMECIGCAQCIDACDAVMTKIGRPKGLIRYSSQSSLEKAGARLVRARVITYPIVLGVVVIAFLIALFGQSPADVTLLRAGSQPYTTTESGDIANHLRVKIVNRSEGERTYFIQPAAGSEYLIEGDDSIMVPAGGTAELQATLVAPARSFVEGTSNIELIVRDDVSFETTLRYRLQGPWQADSRTEGDR